MDAMLQRLVFMDPPELTRLDLTLLRSAAPERKMDVPAVENMASSANTDSPW